MDGVGSSPMKLYLLSLAMPTTIDEKVLAEELEAFADRIPDRARSCFAIVSLMTTAIGVFG